MKSTPALLGLCFDEYSSYFPGTAKAPPLIREAFLCDASNLWSETGIDLGASGIYHDEGDMVPAPGLDFFLEIEQKVHSLLERGFRPLTLGGDHSITFPLLRAFHRHYPNLAILHIDAHPDLNHEFQGNPLSHACPFARIMEAGLARQLVQVGIRTMTGHQLEQARKFGVEVMDMRNWRDDFVPVFNAPVYISIDMDGLDPAFAPGVSHREPGGLSTRQVLRLIQSIEAEVIGADVVEFNPQMDPSGMTAGVAAKLVKELMGKMLEPNG
ncbi:MAG: agmatinase [Blastocatellia bacterium]|nr:agmatinase [Blastocatellia bacterium]